MTDTTRDPPSERPEDSWTTARTRAQFAAIARLRWRITVNSFRRKSGTEELLGRAALGLLFLVMLLSAVLAAGAGAFWIVGEGHLPWLAGLLWGIFGLCQLLNIQLGQPATTFDPTQLIRFPLNVDTYVAIRLFFGLLTPANVTATLASLAVSVGIGLACPGLWLYALIAMAVFAATNVLFSRMVFAWVDRWLSTRRAREVFTALILAISLGAQWANFEYNPAYSNNHRTHAYDVSRHEMSRVVPLYRRVRPVLAVMPPELASTSLIRALGAQRARRRVAHPSRALAMAAFAEYTLAAALYGALFLLVFALRMRTEFGGENLSDAVSGAPRQTAQARDIPPPVREPGSPASSSHLESRISPLAAPEIFEVASRARMATLIAAVLNKEILYVKRNMGILYGLIMPVFLVLVFAGRFATLRSSSLWVFPAAVAYMLLAICPPRCFGRWGRWR